MNHEQVAKEWAEAYVNGSVAERWKIAEACEENGIVAALVYQTLCDADAFFYRKHLLLAANFISDMKAIAAGDDPPTSPACPEAKR